MIVFYFGADTAWDDALTETIRRRNMAILNAISEQVEVTKVYNIIRSTRASVLNDYKLNTGASNRIQNVFIAPILPERGFLKLLFRPLNIHILKYLYRTVFKELTSNQCLAWCYWPKGVDDYEFLGTKIPMVFDTDHNIIDDPNNLFISKDEQEHRLLRSGKMSKFIVSSSRSMLEWYQSHGFSNTVLLLNGVSKNRIHLTAPKPTASSYNVCYCGTLSKWIKMDWLENIIKERPDWTFHFVGDNYKTEISNVLTAYPNVQMYGYLEPKQADRVIAQSDVCFGLYQEHKALDVNSMKLYDYLAQGIPVVVNNYHPNLNTDFNGFINVASNYEEFRTLLESPRPLRKDRLEFYLNSSTWQHRIAHFFERITA